MVIFAMAIKMPSSFYNELAILILATSILAIKMPSFCNELEILILMIYTLVIKMSPSFYNKLTILICNIRDGDQDTPVVL